MFRLLGLYLVLLGSLSSCQSSSDSSPQASLDVQNKGALGAPVIRGDFFVNTKVPPSVTATAVLNPWISFDFSVNNSVKFFYFYQGVSNQIKRCWVQLGLSSQDVQSLESSLSNVNICQYTLKPGSAVYMCPMMVASSAVPYLSSNSQTIYLEENSVCNSGGDGHIWNSNCDDDVITSVGVGLVKRLTGTEVPTCDSGG